jgi:hypothetical protein
MVPASEKSTTSPSAFLNSRKKGAGCHQRARLTQKKGNPENLLMKTGRWRGINATSGEFDSEMFLNAIPSRGYFLYCGCKKETLI